MKVKVVFYSKLLNVKQNTIEVELKDNDTLMSLVEKLSTLYSSELENRIYDKETKTCSVGFLVNGRAEKLSRVLNEGDVVSVIPIVAGG
jgi:molybdopterin converting factor small subunit